MAENVIKLDGLADLKKVMDGLPAKIEANVLRGGLRAGAMVIRNEARQNINAHSGELAKSVRVSMRSRKGVVTAKVKAGGKVAYYAHMVEFGTSAHWIKPKKRKSLFLAGMMREAAKHPGAKPRPFMRPAMDSKAQEALEAMRDYMSQRLPREIEKAGK